ncbi:MAG TPA: galactokinase [Tepidisphaeraceae bacterium]|nr:galactokinase [Tepidisphaeraceae bacterium]
MNPQTAELRQQFENTFGAGGRIHVVRSPGRVNLIGEHTDYNDGFVFPMAIEPEFRIVFRQRVDGRVRLSSTHKPREVVDFSVNERIERGQPQWANYPKGVAAEMLAAGIPLVGMDALVTNTLPVGGGLSSSAAFEVGTALAFLTLAGTEMDAGRIALLCKKAENEYAGVPSGIMDQTIVAAGRVGHAMLLDCRDLSKQFIPLDSAELRVVIANSMVKHELSGGEYAERRHQCEEAVAFFRKADPDVKALRDVTMTQVEAAKGQLSDVVFRRARHVVGENARTSRAAVLLSQRKYEEAGQLMVQSHDSLRDDYEVSVPELDYLVEQAMTVKGVYGARMTGGGFGGCIVALAQPRAVDALSQHLNNVYPKKFNKQPGVFVTTATQGASLIE